MITGYYITPIFCPYKLSNSKEYHDWKKEVQKKFYEQEDSLIRRKWKYEVKMAKDKLDRIT